MMLPTLLCFLSTLAGLAAADLDAAQIIKTVAPSSISCPSTSECRTADQAGPLIATAMSEHNISNANEMAALVALMAYETAEFRYKHNVFPGRAGQGTANMQMARYNLLYAKSIPALAPKVSAYGSVDGLTDDQLNGILGLVTDDAYNFGSPAWFLITQCPGEVREALRRDADGGFRAYMGCVGAGVTDERMVYFQRAKQAFHIG